MDHAQRSSPIEAELHELHPDWGMLNNMPVALAFGRNGNVSVALCDLSGLHRFGVKGPNADAWLKSQGVNGPAGINQWASLADGGIICRLATNEFLIEDGWRGNLAQRLATQCVYGACGVYPVLRQDGEMALAGERAIDLLVQVCSFNFKALKAEGVEVVMTSMAGVGVTVIRQEETPGPVYRIWCDPTYAPYLWETLLGIAKELGGAALGIEEMFPGTVKA